MPAGTARRIVPQKPTFRAECCGLLPAIAQILDTVESASADELRKKVRSTSPSIYVPQLRSKG
jgi:hypothetical protein|eukprot:COSAG01_NODE_2671_length_7269_cov_10.825662_2_plen_63_part_00